MVGILKSEHEAELAVVLAAVEWVGARDALRAAKKVAGAATFVPCESYGLFYDRCGKCPPCLAEAEALGAMWKARARSGGKALRLRNAVNKYKWVRGGEA